MIKVRERRPAPDAGYWRSIFSKITRATSLATFFLRKSTL
jgi:hypothetical protein